MIRNHCLVRLDIVVPGSPTREERAVEVAMLLGMALAWFWLLRPLGSGIPGQHHLIVLGLLDLELHVLHACGGGFFATVLVSGDHELDPLLVLPGVLERLGVELLSERQSRTTGPRE